MKKWLWLVSLLICAAVLTGPVRYNEGDSRYTLLGSESLVHRGSLSVDYYCDKGLDCNGNYRIQKINGHYFYYFPIGTALVSAPAVLLANTVGLNVLDHERYMQRTLACLCLVGIFLLLFRISRLFLSEKQSLILSTIFVFGTSIMGTLAAALWSHNFAMVFSLSAIYLAIKYCLNKNYSSFISIPIFLFLAYLCRPTLFLLAPCLLLFMFSYNKTYAVKSAVILGGMVILFMGYSLNVYGQILPPYYLGERLSSHTFFEALNGNLISPARGLFVFSPFLLCGLLFFKNNNLRIVKKSWLFIGLLWPILHLIAVSRFPVWWGAFSFGPRLMVDALPGIFLLLILVCPKTIQSWRGGIFMLAAIFSIYVNTYQGRYNLNAAIGWNKKYLNDESTNQEVFSDWSIAQVIYPKSSV